MEYNTSTNQILLPKIIINCAKYKFRALITETLFAKRTQNIISSNNINNNKIF